MGDMTGDGIADITIHTVDPQITFIYENKKGKVNTRVLGCGINYTLY